MTLDTIPAQYRHDARLLDALPAIRHAATRMLSDLDNGTAGPGDVSVTLRNELRSTAGLLARGDLPAALTLVCDAAGTSTVLAWWEPDGFDDDYGSAADEVIAEATDICIEYLSGALDAGGIDTIGTASSWMSSVAAELSGMAEPPDEDQGWYEPSNPWATKSVDLLVCAARLLVVHLQRRGAMHV